MDWIHTAGQGQAAELCGHGNEHPDSTSGIF